LNLGLADKIALVVGASSGIGAATAEVLAEEGADVVVGYGHDHEGAERTAQSVDRLGRRSWLMEMDIRQPEAVTQAVERIQTDVGLLDLLIFCAGRNTLTSWEAIRSEEWEEIVGTNLTGAFYVLKATVPLLRQGGSIVTVASVAAHTGAPHHAHYAAAKAGLVNLTKSLARSLAPRIRVNCVAPGITMTPMGQQTIRSLPSNYAEEKIPLRRFATPQEIAKCIVFVASPIAGFMTGATIDINGGRDLR